MNGRLVVATTRRVLRQLRRDPRTMALLLLVPSLLMVLLRYVFDSSPSIFDRIGPELLGIFPFTTMFVVTSVAMLRERTSGTLERLLTMPIAKFDLLAGYAVAFGLVATIQVGIATAVAVGSLGLSTSGGTWLLLLLAVGNALLGSSLGLFFSAFARTEFQAVQFLPAAVLPQILLGGLLVPHGRMASPLRIVSDVLPLSYAVDATHRAAASDVFSRALALDIGVVAGSVVAAIGLGAMTLRRRTP